MLPSSEPGTSDVQAEAIWQTALAFQSHMVWPWFGMEYGIPTPTLHTTPRDEVFVAVWPRHCHRVLDAIFWDGRGGLLQTLIFPAGLPPKTRTLSKSEMHISRKIALL